MSQPFDFIKMVETDKGILKVFNPIDTGHVAQAILIGRNFWANKRIKDNRILAAILDDKFTIAITGRNSFEIIPI